METEILYLMNSEQLAGLSQADHEIVKIFTIRKTDSGMEYVIDSGYNIGSRDVRIGTPVTNPSHAMMQAYSSPQVEESL